jgi:hypothetical protein
MPENIDAIIEADRRGLLKPETSAALQEAYRRGLLKPDVAAKYESSLATRAPQAEPEAPAQGSPEEGPGFFARMGQRITGEGKRRPGVGEYTTRFEDFPTASGALKSAAGMLHTSEPEQMQDIISKRVPGAEFAPDEYGNQMVRVPGRDWEYLNRPGVSPRDVANLIAQGTEMAGAAKGAIKLLGKGAGLAGRAAAVGAATGGASVAADLAAGAAGSEQGVSLPRAGIAAGLGAAGEAILVPIISKFLRAGKKIDNPEVAKKIIIETKQAATPGLSAAKAAEGVTDDMVRQFIDEAKRASDPAQAAAIAEARSLPEAVPLTRGQLTMRPSDQMFEDLAEKGAMGEGAQALMSGARSRTEEALRGNVPAIQQRLGGAGSSQRGLAGEQIQSTLASRAASEKTAITAAYNEARSLPGELPHESAEKIVANIAESIKDYGEFAPNTGKLLANLAKRISPAEGAAPGPAAIDDLFAWRRQVSTLANNVSDKTERAALNAAKRTFDNNMDDAILTSLQSADTKSIEAWKRAITLRKKFGEKFQAGDLVEKLIEREGKQFAIAPEAASNTIFGASNTGLLSKPELAREIRKIKSLLGEGSEPIKALKEEAFVRLTEKAVKGRSFSGAALRTDWATMNTKNAEVLQTLFSPEERKLITQFVSVAERATVPVKGGANFSNTTPALARLTQAIGKSFLSGDKGQAILAKIWPKIYERVQTSQASAAARGVVPGSARNLAPARGLSGYAVAGGEQNQ